VSDAVPCVVVIRAVRQRPSSHAPPEVVLA
jgi:hypothetical protein